MLSLCAVAVAAFAQDPDGATQPGELTFPLESVAQCDDCHEGWSDGPLDTWRGTMMANAVIDPLFLAALSIANKDIPYIGDLCLRCHTPPGWLQGRCAPGDLSQLLPTDYEGVNCDTCHRMTLPPDGPLIANAVYTVVDDRVKRGLIGSDFAPHDVVVDPFLETSEMCGVCHEVSNPLFGDFPIERTYSEWAASSFADFPGGQSCQDCHMIEKDGYASNNYGSPPRTVHLHRFVGGNTFIPRVLAGEHPEFGLGEAYAAVEDDARSLLQDSAVVTVEVPQVFYRGQTAHVDVRVENTTGHKLPSGYPEGRRAWLEVVVTDATGRELLRSGSYDEAEAQIPDDPWLRKYEARLGSNGRFSYHMVEQSEVLFDGRIPPKGFRPTPDIQPVGREFEVLPDGSLANWDLAPYEFTVPTDAVAPVQVNATLWYQTTIREFVEFLRDEDTTIPPGEAVPYGQLMYDLWLEYDRDPPELMELAAAQVSVADPIVFDDTGDDEEPKGCGCDGVPAGGAGALVALGVVGLRRRRV